MEDDGRGGGVVGEAAGFAVGVLISCGAGDGRAEAGLLPERAAGKGRAPIGARLDGSGSGCGDERTGGLGLRSDGLALRLLLLVLLRLARGSGGGFGSGGTDPL